MTWINHLVSVSKGERYVPAIGVKSSVLKTFTQVSVKDLLQNLKEETPAPKSSSVYFASTQDCTLEELKGRASDKCSNTSGWKIPTSMLKNQTLRLIDDACGTNISNPQVEQDDDR